MEKVPDGDGDVPALKIRGKIVTDKAEKWKIIMTEAWVIDACRTPRGIGKYGKGALSEIHPQRLGAAVLKALAERNDLVTAEVDDIIWGCSSARPERR